MAASRFQALGFSRRFQRIWNSGHRFQSSFRQALQEEEKHAEGTLKNWKRISLFIAIPATLTIGYKAFFVDHEEHPNPDNYVPYSHIRIRNKAFPWGDGDHSLFHNDHVNLGFEKTEEGEEEEAELAPKKDHWITKLIVDYLMDDPEENRKKRNEHMALIRERCDEYLEKKRKKQYPPEPMDFEGINTATLRATELGVDGY
ncbi:uncharacterized protein LOC110254009 [Exaiptasia diaphana]|uniref:Cytochrome c oxidase subunit n=1 Tax=Exaiptasia diaphana TaxID=2652724 RepID=A0A913Y8Z5_EXADI|nr:uncharacterized protein LOC110254009 [Exaiptasia diaphana]KXJ21558.1 Cytochrome c oxidase subunit 6A1, mitochondrial [Exaiptasia diaphana]